MSIQAQEPTLQLRQEKQPPRVLIVDDDLSLLEIIAEHFQKDGYEVDTATESEEASALLANIKYALVVTDLALTRVGFRGLDILDHTWDLCERPKVIVLTGHNHPEIQVEAKVRGGDLFIGKPVRLHQLSQAAARLLGKSA